MSKDIYRKFKLGSLFVLLVIFSVVFLTSCSSIPEKTKQDLRKSDGVLYYNSLLLNKISKDYKLRDMTVKEIKQQIKLNRQLRSELGGMLNNG